jgi:predicted amidohydrolase
MSRRDRIVSVATVSQDGLDRKSRQDLIDHTLAIMAETLACRPDIVCLPETFPGYDVEPVPGPITEQFGAWARQHNCYLICPYHTRIEGHRYNSAVLLGRDGKILGRYDKIHPTEGELDKDQGGVRPGVTEPPVFETDFGTIGMQICFDVNWRETWARLKQKGAEIVFFCSAYPAAKQISVLAALNEYYIVSSTKSRVSAIYDITGDMIDRARPYRQWAHANLSLGKRLFETDYQKEKFKEIQRKYRGKVQIVHLDNEDWFTLASLSPEVSVADLVTEYGLTPLQEYLRRCAGQQDEARQKQG